MSCVVISSVANPSSKVNLLATAIAQSLSTDVLNIANLNLPLCDGYACYKDDGVIRLQEQISAADSFIFCAPVYCYDINAVLKNFIELCGAQLKK
ncbi:NAD(P)H-dependent oxidoreductase [bacterium]|nr:NAD(P)H-dependent oxidoreductase [bacterium]